MSAHSKLFLGPHPMSSMDLPVDSILSMPKYGVQKYLKCVLDNTPALLSVFLLPKRHLAEVFE
jgi:hypothetical protein